MGLLFYFSFGEYNQKKIRWFSSTKDKWQKFIDVDFSINQLNFSNLCSVCNRFLFSDLFFIFKKIKNINEFDKYCSSQSFFKFLIKMKNAEFAFSFSVFIFLWLSETQASEPLIFNLSQSFVWEIEVTILDNIIKYFFEWNGIYLCVYYL